MSYSWDLSRNQDNNKNCKALLWIAIGELIFYIGRITKANKKYNFFGSLHLEVENNETIFFHQHVYKYVNNESSKRKKRLCVLDLFGFTFNATVSG